MTNPRREPYQVDFDIIRYCTARPQLRAYVQRCRLEGTTWPEIRDRLEAILADDLPLAPKPEGQ